ncbi:MAG: hypothetical protein AB7M12_02420 [Hyphomonadaceae bacterium]
MWNVIPLALQLALAALRAARTIWTTKRSAPAPSLSSRSSVWMFVKQMSTTLLTAACALVPVWIQFLELRDIARGSAGL